MQQSNGLLRRQLLWGAATGALAFPLVAPRRVWGANDRIRVGVIGAGNRANLLMDQLPKEAEIVAVADCNLPRCYEAAGRRIGRPGMSPAKWNLYQDYRKLLDRKDIDGVIEGTTDHNRALIAIHACQAGKDVYMEKPMTLYIVEGRAVVKAARRYNRIVQVGSQQRSMAMNRVACEFVRNGGLGRLHTVFGVNYTPPGTPGHRPEEAVPPGLDWDMWLGQAALRPYNREIYYRWGSRDFSGGEMTNWGAHGLDQIQSAVGADGTGPVEFWPLEDGPKGAVGFRYANGTTVRLIMPPTKLLGGALFVGDKGWVEIVRNGFVTDPPNLIPNVPPEEEVAKWNRAQWQAEFHMKNWLDCMRTREKPEADAEIGHRSVTVCHLANLTRELGRRLRWDPAAEQFVGDDEANRLAKRKRRKGYELPAV